MATESDVRDIVIRSEEDAYAILELAKDNKVPPYGNIVFDGWPTLSIYLQGDKFHQSITPTVMRGLLEFQRGIYQSYASAKYDAPAKRLSEEEKKALEIRVDVRNGSSDFGINYQDLAVKLIEQLGAKMDPNNVLIAVVTIAVLYFGSSAYKAYLEQRKEIRSKEITDDTQKATLQALQFTSTQETERMKIMAELSRANHRIENIGRIAYDTHSEVIKTLAAGDNSAIEGIEVGPEIAEALTKNARRKSSEVRLDGVYKLLRIDWSNPEKFKVKVRNVKTLLEIDAEVQDDSLTGKYKEALREAEWARSPVWLQINAKLVGEDTYKDAVVLSAKPHVDE